MRLMMEFTGENRGFCFVTYASREAAGRAVRSADGLEVRPGRALGVCVSVDNNRLFVGGLPRQRQRHEILVEMRRLVDGVRDVIVYPDVLDRSRNRGFAFVEFETHRDAAMARRRLIAAGLRLWGLPLAIDWAEPEPELDDDTMSKVRLCCGNRTPMCSHAAIATVQGIFCHIQSDGEFLHQPFYLPRQPFAINAPRVFCLFQLRSVTDEQK